MKTFENLEIENVVDKIKSNYNEIQEKLSSSNVIIVYLGDFELLYEKENIDYMFEQYKSMNGNSYVGGLVEEINKLPVKR